MAPMPASDLRRGVAGRSQGEGETECTSGRVGAQISGVDGKKAEHAPDLSVLHGVREKAIDRWRSALPNMAVRIA